MPKQSESAMQAEVDVYVKTVERMEPNIHVVDRDAALASIAISLKRIADALESERTAVVLSNIEMNLRAGR